jgi:surface protein
MTSGIILKRLNRTIGRIVYIKRKQNGYSHSSDLVYPIRFNELIDYDGMPMFSMSFESIDGISSFDTTKVITFINLIKENFGEYPYHRSERIHVTKGMTKENTRLFPAHVPVDGYCESDKIDPKKLNDKEIELILDVIKHIIIHKTNVDIEEENIIAEDGCVKFIKISTKQTNDIFLKSTDIMNNLEHIIDSFMSVRIINSMNVKLRKNIFTFKMDPRPFASRNIYIFFMEHEKFNDFKFMADTLNNFYFRYRGIERDSDKIDITTIVDPFVLSI